MNRDRSLDPTLTLANALDSDLTRALSRTCAFDHDFTFDRDVVRALLRPRDLARDLDRVCDLARDLDQVCGLAQAQASVHTRVRALIDTLEHTRTLALALDRDLADGRTLAAIRARALARDIENLHEQFGDLLSELHTSVAATPRRKRRQHSRIARRMTAVAVRILPSAHRTRYAQEFAAELYDLAEQSARAQIGYALHLAATAWPLRRTLVRTERLAAWER
jgi:hypothetical protein